MTSKVKWFVTTQGFDSFYNPPITTKSEVIKLDKGQTPVDWFLSKPKCYCRFSYVPLALLNWSKIE